MPKKMLIDATHAEETRVVVVDGNKVEEFDYENLYKRQLAGNIYLAKVIRVEPSLQAAFVDYGGNRHGFLAFSEIHPDYYQIPAADREKLLAEEAAYAQSIADDENKEKPKSRRRRRPSKSKAAEEGAPKDDQVTSDDVIDVDETDAELVEVPENSTTHKQSDQDQSNADQADQDDQERDDPEAQDEGGEEKTASAKDSDIESVADDDVEEEIRPRKPRPRRYKIQEVIKVRQIMLVQVVKEERGNKGAALTTYLSLAGRYCVLMPNTARGGGISRKITNAADRKKLKAVANEIEVPEGAGLIIRTAGAKRNKTDIKRDYEYLQRQWEQVRDLTLKSIAPAQIYAEGDLIKRSIRDLYNRDIDEILVEGEIGYKIAKDYMTMLVPTRAEKVKLYTDPMPLFARYQVEGYLSGMFNPTVQLKSGGYIVIGVTEALVAIDVNSGKSTKEGSIEDTALRTNLEAAEEVARQLRLRDLAGLIVIDFIDMEERRNNSAVERRIKDKLKDDRARIQVGKISGFGLMEMSRQRLRPGMIEATTAPCPACHGTGIVRSDDNQSLAILRELEEEGVRQRSKEVLVKAPVAIANYLLNAKREHVAKIEKRYGMSIRIEADTHLISPDYSVELFKTASRVVTAPEAPQTITVESTEMETGQQQEPTPAPAAAENDEQPKKKRRRRRRRGGRSQDADQNAQNGQEQTAQEEPAAEGEQELGKAATSEPEAKAEETPQPEATGETPAEKPKRKRAPRKKKVEVPAAEVEAAAEEAPEPETAEETPSEKPKRKRAPRKKKVEEPEAEAEAAAEEVPQPETAEEMPAEKPKRKRAPRKKKVEEPAAEQAETEAEATTAPAAEPAPEPEAEKAPEPAPAAEREPELATTAEEKQEDKPKKRGWWSR
jgi:ribonuclease E